MNLLTTILVALRHTGRLSTVNQSIVQFQPFFSTKLSYSTEKKPKKKSSAVQEDPLPSYVQARLDIWTKLKALNDEKLAVTVNEPLKVTLPDGRICEGTTWKTSPFDIAKGISNSLANEIIVAKVNDELWDLERPFEADCNLKLLKFTEPEAQAVFWRSTSFVLSEALERAYGVDNGALLVNAVTVENGFYCDVHLNDKTLSAKDFPWIDGKIVRALFAKHKFERLEVAKSDLQELFAYNQFKIRELEKITADTATVYRCGSYIDICNGPLIRYNKRIKAHKLRKTESVFWNDQNDKEKLQRIYGVSFPSDNMLREWVKQQSGRK